MEDAHIALPSLGQFVAAASGKMVDSSRAHGWDDTALFGVMDGHGGVQVARFCERHLPFAIADGHSDDVAGTLGAAFLRMDELLADPACLSELRGLSDAGQGGHAKLSKWACHPFTVGCTAVVCCIRHGELIVANAGDCRAVLCRGGQAVNLSEDHKPDLPRESIRITRAGGWVEAEHYGRVTVHRVNGDLSLSRAIGDLEYKQNKGLPPGGQLIIATPDVWTFQRDADDEFMVIACDGVWDVISSQEAVDFVRARLGSRATWAERLRDGTLELSAITEELLDHCISPDLDQTDGLGGDNMTGIIVVFVPPESAPQHVARAAIVRGPIAGTPHVITASFRPLAPQRLLGMSWAVVNQSHAGGTPLYFRA